MPLSQPQEAARRTTSSSSSSVSGSRAAGAQPALPPQARADSQVVGSSDCDVGLLDALLTAATSSSGSQTRRGAAVPVEELKRLRLQLDDMAPGFDPVSIVQALQLLQTRCQEGQVWHVADATEHSDELLAVSRFVALLGTLLQQYSQGPLRLQTGQRQPVLQAQLPALQAHAQQLLMCTGSLV